MTADHPAIFYGPEDYDLFITNSVATAALRGCGLGLFSLKSTPGDITETTDDELARASADDEFGLVHERYEGDPNVVARWSPEPSPSDDLSERDDPRFIFSRREGSFGELYYRPPVVELRRPYDGSTMWTGARCPAVSDSGNQCDLVLYADGTHWDFPHHVSVSPREEWSANPTQSEAMMIAGRAISDGLADGLRDHYNRRSPAMFGFGLDDLYYAPPVPRRCLSSAPIDPFPACARRDGHIGPHCSLTEEQAEESLDSGEAPFDPTGRVYRNSSFRETFWVWP